MKSVGCFCVSCLLRSVRWNSRGANAVSTVQQGNRVPSLQSCKPRAEGTQREWARPVSRKKAPLCKPFVGPPHPPRSSARAHFPRDVIPGPLPRQLLHCGSSSCAAGEELLPPGGERRRVSSHLPFPAWPGAEFFVFSFPKRRLQGAQDVREAGGAPGAVLRGDGCDSMARNQSGFLTTLWWHPKRASEKDNMSRVVWTRQGEFGCGLEIVSTGLERSMS